jgi:hypothetical protein
MGNHCQWEDSSTKLERPRLVGVLLGAFQLQGFVGLGFKSCESCGFEPIVTIVQSSSQVSQVTTFKL